MVADVMLAGPEGLGDSAARSDSRTQIDVGEGVAPGCAPGTRDRRRIAAGVLLAVGLVFTGLALLVSLSSWRDDMSIDAHPATAVADVLSVSLNRTAVQFVTPDGSVVIPANGVLYPEGLAAGERVRVEYDAKQTELVRVAGRDYTLTLLPVGSSLLIAWAVIGPLVWFVRRGAPPTGSGSDGRPGGRLSRTLRRASSRRRATS